MKTDALKQALTEGRYDVAIGGARRDEERSRAKERVFSVRGPGHSWDPKRQRPELWHLYNGNLAPGETLRVFPLSNWTELDVWTYILAEGIDVVPLYFAAHAPDGGARRPDHRGRRRTDAVPAGREAGGRGWCGSARSAAIRCPRRSNSSAADLEEIVEEMRTTRVSERAGRLIDQDQDASMEKKKREGYF